MAGQPTAASAATCGTSAGYVVCLTPPASPVTGDTVVSATVSSTKNLRQLEFTWNGAALGTRYASPYALTWPTDRYSDGTGVLGVVAVTTSDVHGTPITESVTLSNGTATGLRNPADWQTLFRSRDVGGDPVFAAVGDGGSGEAKPASVVSALLAQPSTALLYLGDVDEDGTFAEERTNYGRASFDDPTGQGELWGRLAGYTIPAFGNHEVRGLPAWQDYWHQRPFYTSYDVGGVHVIVLDSECKTQSGLGGCTTSSPMYQWALADLSANTLPCVVAVWHRPVLGVTQQAPWMAAFWDLLATHGGDLVLSAHDHAAEAWLPMNAGLVAGQPDSHMVQLVSGAGGHFMITLQGNDARMDWQVNKTPAIAYVTAVDGAGGAASRLDWRFSTTTGSTLQVSGGRSAIGSVSCGLAPVDNTPPSAPGQPVATSTTAGIVDLSWQAATDPDDATLGYDVYRDGGSNPIGSLTSSAAVVSYTDTGLEPGSTHTYVVRASDSVQSGPPSPASEPVTVAGLTFVFKDDFAGGLSGWSVVKNASLSTLSFGAAPPSVVLTAASSPAYLQRSLPSAYGSLCVSTAVNVVSVSGNTTLIKLRTASGGPIARLFVDAGRAVYARDDYTGKTLWTGARLPTGWSTVQLCSTTGTAGPITVSVGGSVVGSWAVNTGPTGVGMVRIGDDAATTTTAYVDDVIAR